MANPADWIHLRSAAFDVQINPLGAELSVLRDAQGRDLLWHGDPAIWRGRAPVLFPIVGELHEGHYTWQGKRYALQRHGIARHRRFEVLRSDEREALLKLSADAATLEVYPFAFELRLHFRLDAVALIVEASVRNTGPGAMPASLGFHPGFRWPLPDGGPREDHFIEFEFDESAPVRRLDARGLLIEGPLPSPVEGRRLLLRDDLFHEDVLIFDRLRSRRLTYGSHTGRRLQVSFPDATHLGIWTKPGAGFVCIEPWRGVADPVGFGDTLADKPGIFSVAPGEQQSLLMRIE